jgi:hypothetical protein
VPDKYDADQVAGGLHRTVHQFTERAVKFFNSRLPDLQPYAKAHLPAQEHLLVFLHIPRTAGDSMRTHLFNAADWDFTPFEVPPTALSDKEVAALSSCRLIKGFLSIRDVMRFPPSRRVFTFLRDPVERSLSLYYFLGRGATPTTRALSIQEFFHSDNPLLASYARNGMTWQLGDMLNINERTLSEVQALERAKEALHAMDFVGFYEDLSYDFKRLRRELFANLRIHPFFPALFKFGALITVHRRRVRKYARTLTPAELAIVREANSSDIELYDYARAMQGRHQALHDSYSEWTRSAMR